MSDKILSFTQRTLAEALDNVRCLSDIGPELIAEQVFANLAKQPAQAAVPANYERIFRMAVDSLIAAGEAAGVRGEDQLNGATEIIAAINTIKDRRDSWRRRSERAEAALSAPTAPVPAAQEPAQQQIDESAAHNLGAIGAEPAEFERRLFEAWMRGHCWAVVGEWDGRTYVAPSEHGRVIDPAAMLTRQLWAAWRDRAALAGHTAPPAAEQQDITHCACGDAYPSTSYGAGFIDGSGMCPNCDAAIPARDISAIQTEQPDAVKMLGDLVATVELITHDDRVPNELSQQAAAVLIGLRALLGKDGEA